MRSLAILALVIATHSFHPSPANAEPDVASLELAKLVPRHLLALTHSKKVQQELDLSAEQLSKLESFFAEIDGPWFRARILPAEKQQEVISDLEQRMHRWFSQNASALQHERLRQLEIQAQSARSLLRLDVARKLELTPAQQQKLVELARATFAAQDRLRKAQSRGEAVGELEAAFQDAAKAEQSSLKTLLRLEQLQVLGRLVGKPFDTQSLQRIYPMAPELISVEHWINSQPLTLQQLRGKVVLVHFYAFQCHNCHANFGIYQRWHQELSDQGVVVLGIQTPETQRERDPAAVKTAAAERDLNFPILVDLDSANWKAWGNTMWPTVYIVDKHGYVRHWWQGELNWKGATGDATIEKIVTQLLLED